MSARIDHGEAAKEWIANSVKAQASVQPNNEQLAAAYASIAQTHATLALVEQQRIANLLTVAGWVVQSSTEDYGRDLDTLQMGVAGEIWEGLGL